MHVPRVALLQGEEAVLVEEGDRLASGALDILLRALLVDRPLGAAGLAEDHLEGVLTPVEALEPELPVGRPADAGQVLVALRARVDAGSGPRGEVGDPQLHRGVALARLRVLEREGLVVALAVEAHHLHERHLALVEAQEGDAAAVGREGVGPREAELLLVDPVRRAVDHLVPRPVVGDAERAVGVEVADVEVVAVGVGDLRAVGREARVAGRLGFAQHGAHRALLDEVVGRGVGVAVDRRAARGDEDAPLVGREGVVGDGDALRRGGQQPLARRVGRVGVAQDLVALEARVVLAVGHRADAAHGFVHGPQTGDFGVFAFGGGRRREEEGRKERKLGFQVRMRVRGWCCRPVGAGQMSSTSKS